MPAPESIQQFLSALEKGRPPHQEDFFNICRAFALMPGQEQFLLQIRGFNPKLAETLAIFRRRLREAAAGGEGPEQLIGQAFLHYIINTDGLIPEAEGEDPFDVSDWAGRYAESLNIGLAREEDGTFCLEVDGKKAPCPEWNILPGRSAAGSLRSLGPAANRLRYGRDEAFPSFAFGFDENAEAHAMPNALALADCSHLAYFGPAFVENQLRRWGFESFRWVENEKTDTQAFVAGKGGQLVLCFRGTSSGADALVDARFLKTEAFGGRGRVHRGFNSALDSVWSQLQAAVDALGGDKKLFACGHSLGAALAQLAAHRLALSGYQLSGVYVYGSPRVGNREFMEAYNELLEEKTFLHINNKDIVARIPPRILGFNHLGGSPRLFDEGHAISLMPKSKGFFEDEEQEMDFEALDEAEKEAIMHEMREAQECLKASSCASADPAALLEDASSKGFFDNIRPVDDHSMDGYLFKLGRAMVDEEWAQIEGK